MNYVALLRGINVGSGRSVPMADLRTVCEGLGWQKVRTYIQSGNVIFEADPSSDPVGTLERALKAQYGFAIPVLVRTADEWQTLAADTPFGGWSDSRQLSVSLLDAAPEANRWQALAPWRDGDDEIELLGDRVWVKTPGGYGATKFHNAFLEKNLGRRATTRNRATVEALLAML